MTGNGSSPSVLEDHLKSLLPQDTRSSLTTSVLPTLVDAIAAVSKTLQASHHVALVGTANAFGDDQLNIDVSAEKIIRDALARCPSIVVASSEEDPVERPNAAQATTTTTTTEQYTVAFDPLDGSSIIAPNWSVGTIVSIWDGTTALNQAPATKQVAAVLGVYGPRTTVIVALRIPGVPDTCFEVGIDPSDGSSGPHHPIIRPNIRLDDPPLKTRYFAPANLRSAAEDDRYMRLIQRFICEKYTLRYCGGLVPDLVHALVQGNGLYVSPVTGSTRAKLRRLYELCPVALVMECAGGKAVDPSTGDNILERPVADCDERGGLVCGTREEVDAAVETLLG